MQHILSKTPEEIVDHVVLVIKNHCPDLHDIDVLRLAGEQLYFAKQCCGIKTNR